MAGPRAPRGSGKPEVILLPGLLCDARLFEAQTAALADRARFSVPDLSPYDSTRAMADAVLAAAPERFALAGFSMGGYVALDIIGRAPHRVERLALLSTNSHALPATVAAHLGGAIAVIEAGNFDAYVDDAFPLYVAPERAGDAALKGVFSAMARDQGGAAAVRQIRALLSFTDHRAVLTTIDCPTAIICGALDERAPVAVHHEFADTIAGSTLTIVEGSGHFTPLEKPSAVTSALGDWLAR